jgi:hypothetical protein
MNPPSHDLDAIPFVDHDDYRTHIEADGKTTVFAGRPKPGFPVLRLVRPGGITSIVTERIARDSHKLFSDRLRDAHPEIFSSQPMTSSKRKYTITFDGHPTTKPIEAIADSYTEQDTGEFEFKLDGKLVAFHRFVKSVSAEDLPPTVEELQAEVARLTEAKEAHVSGLRERIKTLENRVRALNEKVKYAEREFDRIGDMARDALSSTFGKEKALANMRGRADVAYNWFANHP